MFPSIVERVIESYCWETVESTNFANTAAWNKVQHRNRKLNPEGAFVAPLLTGEPITACFGGTLLFVKSAGPSNVIWRRLITEETCEQLSDIKFSNNERIITLLTASTNPWLVIFYQVLSTNEHAFRIVHLYDYSVLCDRRSIKWRSRPVSSYDERLFVMYHEDGLCWDGMCDTFELRNSLIDNLEHWINPSLY